MSKSKQKGTVGENEILELLKSAGMRDAHRTEAARASHDIWCGPVIVEVKYRKAWAVMDWVRKIRNVAPDNRWVVFAIHGDRRTAAGSKTGRVAVFDADFAAELLAMYRGFPPDTDLEADLQMTQPAAFRMEIPE